MTPANQRIVTGLVGAPVVLALAWYGGWPFIALVGLACLVAQFELYQLAGLGRHPLTVVLGLFAGMAVLLRVYVGPEVEYVLIAGIVGIVASSVLLHPSGKALLQSSVAIAGILYPTLLLSYASALRISDGLPGVARELTLLTIVGVWSADTSAYFVGRKYGKHHMSAVSPKKTWEGYVGGVIGSILVVALVSSLIGPLTPSKTIFIGLVAGVVGPIGDLAESTLKRSVHVKDSGSLLPGHGGLLDRLDALIVVAPLVYVWALLVGFI